MVFYIISIVGCDALIALINIWVDYFNLPVWKYFLISALGAVLVIAIDGAFAAIVRWILPNKWFTYDVKFHRASKKECNFYEKLGIKKWKDYVVELNFFINFSKTEVQNPQSRAYVERFILENNYGMWVHTADVFFGFLLIFCLPLKYRFAISLPVACVNAFLNVLPIWIARYNNSRLLRIRDVLEKKEKRTDNK